MEVNGVDRNSVAPVAAAVIPPDKAAENREMVRAVHALNGAEMFGRDRELVFKRDHRTERILLRVVSRETGEVLLQIPAEEVLRMAESLRK